ncbi:MAG TPA: hypothetical protein DD473_07735 [Planctomycetaceae bacterium]|nr:hypothetical protein [Planctomycetaceae bacterium]
MIIKMMTLIPLLFLTCAVNSQCDAQEKIKLPSIEDQLIAMINQERQRKGLSLVARNEQLMKASHDWSKRMVDENFFDHVKGNSTPVTRAADAGYQGHLRTENVAGGHHTPLEAFRGWLDSGAHYDNMLIPELTEIGIGAYAKPNGDTFWTMMGGVRQGSPTVPAGNWVDRYSGPNWEQNKRAGGPILFSNDQLNANSLIDPKRPNHRVVIFSGILDETREYEIELNGAQLGPINPINNPYIRLEDSFRNKLNEATGDAPKFKFKPTATGQYHIFCSTAGPNETGGLLFKLFSSPAE